MTRVRIIFISGVVVILSACSSSPAMTLLQQHHNDILTREDFGICKGYGCRYYLKTGLSLREWQRIMDIFAVPARTTAQERQLIKTAIGLFERFVGPKTGTDTDKAGARIINFSTRDQMDCIDEAFNTTTYLFILHQAGLIRLHSLGKPLRRGNYIDRWPHNTATIHEIGRDITIKGEGHYVVDSWFHANGEEPETVPAALWSQGWSPDHR